MNRRATFRCFIASALALAILVAPTLAEARAGRGSSLGSRGSRTYSQPAPPSGSSLPNLGAAQPIERSVTPPPAQAQPQRPSAVGPQVPTPQPSAVQRHPFVSGLLGGLVGAGLGSLLFGGHFFGEGSGGFLGVVVQLLLLLLAVRLAWGFFARRTSPGGLAMAQPQVLPPPRAASPAGGPVAFPLLQDDLSALERLLVSVQAAWTHGDAGALGQLATPEMAGYFAQQLAEDRARGAENRVEDVRLLRGDVNETWQEGPLQYATVTMQWSARDYTLDRRTGAVVAGNPQVADQATEVWTVVRRPGSPWQLSAIQQLQLLN
jgi:predicted lipid-binding transport protein (Tim44 family)